MNGAPGYWRFEPMNNQQQSPYFMGMPGMPVTEPRNLDKKSIKAMKRAVKFYEGILKEVDEKHKKKDGEKKPSEDKKVKWTYTGILLTILGLSPIILVAYGTILLLGVNMIVSIAKTMGG